MVYNHSVSVLAGMILHLVQGGVWCELFGVLVDGFDAQARLLWDLQMNSNYSGESLDFQVNSVYEDWDF